MSAVPMQPVAAFDYGGMKPSDAEKVRATAAHIRRSVAAHYRDTGELLIEAKGLLPYGAFATWARTELGIEPRMAQRYISAALFLRGRSDTMSHLPAAAIYALAAPNTPADVVRQAVADAEDGVKLDGKAIAARIAAARRAEVPPKPGRWRLETVHDAQARHRAEREELAAIQREQIGRTRAEKVARGAQDKAIERLLHQPRHLLEQILAAGDPTPAQLVYRLRQHLGRSDEKEDAEQETRARGEPERGR